jgi:hypothetical protein
MIRCMVAIWCFAEAQASPELIPEEGSPPGFGIAQTAFDTSAAVRLRFASHCNGGLQPRARGCRERIFASGHP